MVIEESLYKFDQLLKQIQYRIIPIKGATLINSPPIVIDHEAGR